MAIEEIGKLRAPLRIFIGQQARVDQFPTESIGDYYYDPFRIRTPRRSLCK